MDHTISASVIKRLPRYYRLLGELMKNGIVKISSRQLADFLGSTASQIRQDLNCFGGFGQQGYGYNVQSLREKIGEILGISESVPTILIGVGNLGKAIAQHIDFCERGFNLLALFDSNPDLEGEKVGDYSIKNWTDIEVFCKENRPKAAILCIPKDSAKAICEKLISLGVNGFWNFSHYDLTLNYPDIISENVHIGDSLMTLGYKMKNK